MPYVSLDLETTGLDPERDRIIEVAAVRFDVDGVIDRYESLVNPDRELDYHITLLTGIDAGALASAPHFNAIAREVETFIGMDPIVGQNPTFDTDFLARAGVTLPGPAYDTFDLASLLIHDLRERSLGAICDHLGISFETRHRAMPDADAAREVFLLLRARLAASPADLIIEAARAASASDWTLRHLLHELAADAQRLPANGEPEGFVHGFVRAPVAIGEALRPSSSPRAVAPDESARLITSGAAHDALDAYEERPEQVAMTRAVAETLAEGDQLIVEAGTGVGKSLAYIVPSAMNAVRNSARTVISTNTINLQDQLMAQDFPIARRILASAGIDEGDLRVAQLKGRRNYLCLLRWSAARRSGSISSDEARVLVKLLFWLGGTETGDRAELSLRREEEHAWWRLSAQDGGCMTMQCPFVRDGSCFLYRARRRAESAHLLVVNHALLLSDIAAGGNVLPEYQHLVVDEAHHLESEATNQFGFTASEANLLDWLDRLNVRSGRDRESGLVSTMIEATRGSQQAIGAGPQVQAVARVLAQSVAKSREPIVAFFRDLRTFGQQHAAARGDYDDRIVINRGIRVQPDWSDIETAWFAVDEQLAVVCGVLDEAAEMLGQANPSDILDRDAVVAEVTDLMSQGEELRGGISRIIGQDDRAQICWMTMGRQDGSPALASAPLSVAETLSSRLFGPRESVVLTSATLATDEGFGYIKSRLGADDARELRLGSPFDYRKSTLLMVPTDMPEPDQVGYAAAVRSALIEVVEASEGRALVLFTSHAALRTAYDGIKLALADRDILALAQGIDGSPRQLLSTLRDSPRTVVLGAASFWEGVDVTGDALSLLVIARLPFPVPSDPVFSARSEHFDMPFEQYAVPQAILRFKQGFGRLIRSKNDRGALIVLDRRIRSRKYGDAFMQSIPSCTVHYVPLRDLPGEVSAWLPRRAGVAP